MTKKRIERLLVKLLGAIAFVFVSCFALFLAYGYQPKLSFRDIQKTSIIDITARFKNIRLFLDGQFQANELPYQMKGIVPGSYKLAIHKVNFLPWYRQIQVKKDVVTKVTDVLLFPEHVDSFLKTVNRFLPDARFFMGKDELVVVRPNQNYLTILSFFNDGTLKQDELKLSRSDIENVEFLADRGFMVSFQETSTVEIVDPIRSESLLFPFTHPFGRLTMDYNARNAYFLFQKDLYRVPFAELATFEENFDSFKIFADIEQFTMGSHGIYILKKGLLVFTDLFGKQAVSPEISAATPKEVSTSPAEGPGSPSGLKPAFSYDNLSFREGNFNDGFLVLKAGGQRFLYYVDKEGKLSLLTGFLQGDYFLNTDGEVLFVTAQHTIFVYDSRSSALFFIQQLEEEGDLIGWYGENDHFLFKTEKGLNIADRSFSNVYSFDFEGGFEKLYLEKSVLYLLADHKLKILSF